VVQDFIVQNWPHEHENKKHPFSENDTTHLLNSPYEESARQEKGEKTPNYSNNKVLPLWWYHKKTEKIIQKEVREEQE